MAAITRAGLHKPRGASRLKQSGFVRLGMFLARWGSGRPSRFTYADLFRASEPGAHFEAYDPNSLLERRNFFLWTEDGTNSYWTKDGVTAAQVLAAAPDGVSAATRILETAVNSQHAIYQAGYSFLKGVPQTFSWYVKPDGRTRIKITGTSSIHAALSIIGQVFEMTGAGSVVNVVAGVTATISAEANGFYRIGMTFVPEAEGGFIFGLFLVNAGTTSSYAGDVTKGAIVFGAMAQKYTTTLGVYQKITNWDAEFIAAGGDSIAMWQDSNGTTPVTRVEDPIGLFHDKRLGLARGVQNLADPGFDDPTKWTTSATWAIAGSSCTLTNCANTDGPVGTTSLTIVAGAAYEVFITVSAVTLGGIRATVGGVASPGAITTPGTYRYQIVAGSAAAPGVWANGTTSGVITSFSVRAIPGNHATQSTAGFRPRLGARVNGLVKTEQFDDPTWTKLNMTVSVNAAVAPDGLSTADKLVEGTFVGDAASASYTSYTFAVNTAYEFAVYAKAAGRNRILVSFGVNGGNNPAIIADLNTLTIPSSNGAVTGSGVEDVGDGWRRVWLQFSTGAAINSHGFGISPTSNTTSFATTTGYNGDGASGIYAWGADLRTGADAALAIPEYQRVYSATEYDTVGFPHRVRHDKTDDYLSFPMNLSSTDAVTVWMAGNLKTADDAAQVLVEFTANSGANAGAFGLFGPGAAASASYMARSRGAASSDATTATAYAAPQNAVLTMSADISADTVTLDVNGVAAANSSTDQGAGSYANSTGYIGARAGTSLRSGVGWTSLTVRGAASDAATKTSMNSYAANLAKITL